MLKRNWTFMILCLLTLFAFSLQMALAQDEATQPVTEEVSEVTLEAPVVVTEAPDAPPVDEVPVEDDDAGWLAAWSAFSINQIIILIALALFAVLLIIGEKRRNELAKELRDAMPKWAFEEYFRPLLNRGLDEMDKRTDIPNTTLDDDLRKYIRDQITAALDQPDPDLTLSPRP